MDRRGFVAVVLSVLAALPFMGWLSPKKSVASSMPKNGGYAYSSRIERSVSGRTYLCVDCDSLHYAFDLSSSSEGSITCIVPGEDGEVEVYRGGELLEPVLMASEPIRFSVD